jgi:riboflavin synthase
MLGAKESLVFTGVIEHLGTIESLKLAADGGRLTVHTPMLAQNLAVSNSISVNGCCLTVVAKDNKGFSADLSGETLRKTSLGQLATGMKVNLEQPLTAGKEFGGHFVLGHVDTTGRVTRLDSEGESWW